MNRLLIPLFFLTVLLLLPQLGFSQEADADKFIDPNQSVIDSLLSAIKPDSPDSVKAWNYSRVANTTCDFDTSLKYSFLSLDYCNEAYSDFEELRAYNYNIIALAYYMKDESRKALQYRLMSAAFYNKISDKRREAGTFIHIGNCYLDLNIKDSVFYYYNKGIMYLTELKDTSYLIESYKNLGQIYASMSLYSNAVENHRKALDYALPTNGIITIACCYCLLGSALNQQSDTLTNLAIENLTKSVRLFESDKNMLHYDIDNKHYAYMELAQAYIKIANQTGRSDYADSSRIYVSKASNYYKSVGSYNNYVSCRYCYVQYLVFKKKYNDALAELLGLKKFLTDDNLILANQTYYNNLYEIYLLLGDYRNALKCHEKYMEYKMASVNDSTLNLIKDAEVERAQMLDSINHHYEKLRIESEHQNEMQRQRSKTITFMIVAVLFAFIFVVIFFYYKTLRENEENKLRRRTLEIERTLLRTQMNPHFIFNALNSIQNFIVSNNSLDAERYLSKFAKLMRMILDNSMKQNITLDNELLSLTLYIDLEKARFNNRFTYQINIDDNIEEELILVPAMLIQPFVENAILHGLLHKNDDNGLITIDITENPDKHLLTCSITDNGIGRKAAAEYSKTNKGHHSVGMQLTRDRLKDLNKETEGISCNIEDLYDSSGNALGTKVTILIPYTEDV